MKNFRVSDLIEKHVRTANPPLSSEAMKNAFYNLFFYTKGLETAIDTIFKDGIKIISEKPLDKP